MDPKRTMIPTNYRPKITAPKLLKITNKNTPKMIMRTFQFDAT